MKKHTFLEKKLWAPAIRPTGRATLDMPVQCFADDASLPPSLREAHALIRELQFPANCSSQRILEWPGIRGTLTGIGSAMHDVTVAMAVAWASGRTLVMSMRSPPKDSWYLEACKDPKASNVYECMGLAPISSCVVPRRGGGPDHHVLHQQVIANNCTLPPVLFSTDPRHRVVTLPQNPIATSNCFAGQAILLRPAGRPIRPFASALPLWRTGALSDYIKAYALASSFFLRPGPALRRRIERTLADAFKGDEPRPEDTLGMPLRGSDKCGLESTCPSFASHMAAAERIRAAHPHVSTILLTSDDVTYLKEWPNYSPRWRFVLNNDDVHQATGGLRKEQANLIGHTKRDIFASMLGTLQLQLRARYWLVNCKSEWHRLIVELARTGRCAGGAEELVVQCSESKAMHMKDGERMTEFVPVQ